MTKPIDKTKWIRTNVFSCSSQNQNQNQRKNVKQVSALVFAPGELANIKLWQMSEAAKNETSKYNS